MPGYDLSRFVNLPEQLATNLRCQICRDIYREPLVNQRCGHSFCRSCIEKFIISTTSEKNKRNGSSSDGSSSSSSSSSSWCCCPQCRLPLQQRQPLQLTELLSSIIDMDGHHNNTTAAGGPTNTNNNTSVVIIGGDYQLTRNLTVDSIVGELLIKCQYWTHGCTEVLPVREFAEHFKQCRLGRCPDCDLELYDGTTTYGDTNGHHCIDRLKSALYNRLEYIDQLESGQLKFDRKSKWLLSVIAGIIIVGPLGLVLFGIYAIIYGLTGLDWLAFACSMGILGLIILAIVRHQCTSTSNNNNNNTTTSKPNGQSSSSSPAPPAAQGSGAQSLSPTTTTTTQPPPPPSRVLTVFDVSDQ